MLGERDRFLKLFDIQVKNANAWLAKMPKDKYDWIPIENPNVQLGARVPTLTIKAFHIHMTVSDRLWFTALENSAEGEELKIPLGEELTNELFETDFASECTKMHEENVKTILSYSAETLSRNIKYANVERTGMEFLWNAYAHRAHHLGHMDIYLRQANVEAPAYYPF